MDLVFNTFIVGLISIVTSIVSAIYMATQITETTTPDEAFTIAVHALILFLVLTTAIFIGFKILVRIKDNIADRKWNEYKAKVVEASSTGYDIETFQKIRKNVNDYLHKNKLSTTEQIVEGVNFTEEAKSLPPETLEDMIRFAGLIGHTEWYYSKIGYYGKNPITQQWSNIGEDVFVDEIIAQFKKYINTRPKVLVG